VGQAEALARKSSAAMENALARLHKAEEDVAVLREAIKAAQAKARNTPKKRKKEAEEPAEAPTFEVPPEEREYKGDPNDRKALVRHRQRLKVGLPSFATLRLVHSPDPVALLYAGGPFARCKCLWST
jgi:hypothetical protein